MSLTTNLPKETPQEVRDLIEQLEKDRDAARAELDAIQKEKEAAKRDVRNIKDKKEYAKVRDEALRSLARARLGNPVTPPEPKDVRTMTKAEYAEYKKRTMDAVRQRRS